MKRILIVDDDRFFLKVLSEAFIGSYAVETALSGEEAVEILKQQGETPGQPDSGFDLIITDFNMPGMSGLEFASFVKHQNRFTRFTPVILLTQQEMTKEQARLHGCASYVPKSEFSRVVSLASILLNPR